MASASGSISAARGRKNVGESWWIYGLFEEEEEEEYGDEEGRKCAASFWRREVGGDILVEWETGRMGGGRRKLGKWEEKRLISVLKLAAQSHQ